jgi:hypothetical protein
MLSFTFGGVEIKFRDVEIFLTCSTLSMAELSLPLKLIIFEVINCRFWFWIEIYTQL